MPETMERCVSRKILNITDGYIDSGERGRRAGEEEGGKSKGDRSL
jgi:hypothetical protein